jgi:integrase
MSKPAVLSHKILDGAVSLYLRKTSPLWQCGFHIGNTQLRASTKCKDFDEAKKVATDLYLNAKFREREGLPTVTKSFQSVAELAKTKLSKAISAGQGKAVYKDYIEVIDKYLIPFFGKRHIDKVDYLAMNDFSAWRLERFNGKKPAASTITTHNSALNRVFDAALERGYITKSQIPELKNDGAKGNARADFTLDEYRQLYRFMRQWVKQGKKGIITEKRELLRDYVLILANTGMRHGTESYGIKWKHIRFAMQDGAQRLMISVDGKTGQRELVARNNVVPYLKRIQSRTKAIKDMAFEELLKSGNETYLFSTKDSVQCKTLSTSFKVLMQDSGLLIDRRENVERTLYCLRHTYATMSLLHSKISHHKLAKQMGTSIKMIEDHYSKLIPLMAAKELAGKIYTEKVKKKKEQKLQLDEITMDKATVR